MHPDRIIYIVQPIGPELRETNQSDTRKTGKTPLVNHLNLKVGKALHLNNRIKGYQRDVGNIHFLPILNDLDLTVKELQILETNIKRAVDQYRVRNPHSNRKTEWLHTITFTDLRDIILIEHEKYKESIYR